MKERKIRRYILGILFLFLTGGCSLLSGCNTIEVEDRIFPLALAVDETSDIAGAWLNQEEAGTKMVDYNHLKVLILGESILTSPEELNTLLMLMEQEDKLPRNTYVVASENAKELMALNEELEEGLGTYLEELLEGNASMKTEAYPTLGTLYQERFNKKETCFLPYLSVQEGVPFVEKYYVWKRGEAAGTVRTEQAMLSALLQGRLEKETLCFASGSSIRLSNFKTEMEMEEASRKVVRLQITCEGEMLYQEKEENFDKVVTDFYQQLAEEALAQSVDLSNSFKSLGGYQRSWYEEYQKDAAGYEEDISIEIGVHITWTTT